MFNNETLRWVQHRFKSRPGFINTVEINKVALKNKDNKRLRTFDGITTYPYGTNAFKVCKSEMEIKIKNKPELNKSLLIRDEEKHEQLNNIPIALYY